MAELQIIQLNTHINNGATEREGDTRNYRLLVLVVYNMYTVYILYISYTLRGVGILMEIIMLARV